MNFYEAVLVTALRCLLPSTGWRSVSVSEKIQIEAMTRLTLKPERPGQ